MQHGKNVPPSIIAADMRVNGDLICGGAIHIDGWIEGDVQCQDIVIGEAATVHGNVHGETVRICGAVEGQVKADNVILAKTARVRGDVLHKTLTIEQVAFFEGVCKRTDAKPSLVQTEIKATSIGIEALKHDKLLAVS